MRPISVTITPAQSAAGVRMDNYATAVVGGQIVPSGGATWVLYHSFDDPNDLVNPVPATDMMWDQSLLPPGVASGTVAVSFVLMTCPLWFRIVLFGMVGAVRATFLQVGEHSHSNISQGPFAPPRVAGELVAGSNFGAMSK